MIVNNTNKIKQLKITLFNFDYNFVYAYLIIKLLDNGSLNKLIKEITKSNTKVNVNSFIRKSHLSGNEQFLILLENFISEFKNDFYFLNENFDYIVGVLLQNESKNSYLLCKNYIGDNNFIDYFYYNIRKLIIRGFYSNIKFLAKRSEIISFFAKDNHIDLKRNFINEELGIDILYDLLNKMSICNVKSINCFLLFENIDSYIEQVAKKSNINRKEIESSLYDFYVEQWEVMIDNYNHKKEALEILFY